MYRWLSRDCSTRLLLTLALPALLATGGCSSLRGVPARYQPTAAIVESIKLTPDDLAQLQATADKAERNRLQNKALSVIDLNYHQFVRDLVSDRQDMSAASGGIALGAATAGAFVDSVAAKTNYALLAATAIGAFGLIDRNYYYEKTVPALVAAMGAARASMLLRIRTSQREPIDVYNGVAALADLEDYFTAGSILAAIAEITTRADTERQKTLAEVRALTVPTDDEIAERKRMRSAIFAVNEQSLAKANAVLKALGRSPKATAQEARAELIIAFDPTNAEQISALRDALQANGLLK